MNSRIRPSFIPQCSACVRGYIESGLPAWRPLIQQQTRGAKSARNPDTIPVQLLKDLETFGKKGAFIPIPAGTMRNKWFPFKVARYPTFEERKAIKRGDINVIRDYEFAIRTDAPNHQRQLPLRTGSEEAAWRKYLASGSTTAASIEIKAMEPARAIALLDVLLPDSLDFERKPVAKPQSHSDNKSKLPASVQAMLKASIPQTPTAIYGSLSTNDVAQFIRDTVAYNDEAAQIQINESNLKFVEVLEGDDATKIKHLGSYEVEISFKGIEKVVRKRVVVKKPEEERDEALVDPSIGQTSSSTEVVDHR